MNTARTKIKVAPKRLTLLLGALLATSVLLCAGASSASAVLIGLNESGQGASEQDMEAVRRSGANVYQLGIVWKRIADQGNWKESPAWQQTYDIDIERAARNEVNLVGGLYGRRTEAAIHQYYLSNEWNEWLQYVWTVVQRYGRNGAFWAAHPSLPYKPITSWTVWNEPNLAMNNPGGSSALPQKYAEFLIATSNTITQAQDAIRKAGEPNDTRVIHGGLYQPAGMAVGTFLEKASKIAGYGSSFTEFGLHPYSFSGSEAQKIAGLASNVEQARNALNAWVGSGKPMWLNELGWPIAGTGEPSVSEAEQAKLLTSALDWVKANASKYNIELVTWYFYKDLGGSTWDGYCGLRDQNGRYRESWYAFQKEAGAPKWPVPSPPPNLFAVALNHTGEHHTGVHVLDAATQFQTWLTQRETALGETSPAEWQWAVADENHDGVSDLVGVSMNHTGEHHTGVHVLNGATEYQTWLTQRETPLGETSPAEWQWTMGDVNGDGVSDLVGVSMNHTGGHHTGVHVLNGATEYQTWLVQQETPLAETSPAEWQWTMGDVNGDKIADLVGVSMNHTGGHHTGVHVLSGATQFQTWLVQQETPLAETSPAEWQWTMTDENHDGIADLVGVSMNHTGGHHTGVHVLSGATQFQTWLTQQETPLSETSPTEWQFVAGF